MNQKGWLCFIKLCMATQDEKILTELFALLFTHEETASLETRCLIVQSLLINRDTQRHISEDLNVSIAKITRGSNELKRISPRLRKYLLEQLT